jgi:hypothetical protein
MQIGSNRSGIVSRCAVGLELAFHLFQDFSKPFAHQLDLLGKLPQINFNVGSFREQATAPAAQ